ncbi:MAG: hypothetical protein IPI66_14435 [Chitinophagaceae bacterium]|nr:hypothetical protein [Chitinophagaceae bacterium]
MCFSATASFGASALLCTAGLITLKRVRDPNQVLFAGIPLLFSVQQLAEGFVWLSLTRTEYQDWQQTASGFFLFFAQVLWPLLVPLSIWMIERSLPEKILFLLTLGALLAIFMSWRLLEYPSTATVVSNHIDYTLGLTHPLSWIVTAVYLLVTIGPPFVSGNKKLSLLGLLVLASFLITLTRFPGQLISIWCYFAAVISVVVLFLISDMNKIKKVPPLEVPDNKSIPVLQP